MPNKKKNKIVTIPQKTNTNRPNTKLPLWELPETTISKLQHASKKSARGRRRFWKDIRKIRKYNLICDYL
ncbi:MAG: hypothetical protein LBJ00_10840 [Planctomycetaceae bacterium]|jgi:hypothetical protein|nr:hypothetical protein [Planctomycetaceae bacterium]